MRTHDIYLVDILRSLGFAFTEEYEQPHMYICEEISKTVDHNYGPQKHYYKYKEYEITISDISALQGRYHFQKFYLGKLTLEGHSNSYRHAIIQCFNNILKTISLETNSLCPHHKPITKFKFISQYS